MKRKGFHDDMLCGSCMGPLEDDRTAICQTCAPESSWFAECADAEDERNRSGAYQIPEEDRLEGRVLKGLALLLLILLLGSGIVLLFLPRK